MTEKAIVNSLAEIIARSHGKPRGKFRLPDILDEDEAVKGLAYLRELGLDIVPIASSPLPKETAA